MKAYQAQVAAAGAMAQTQPAGTVGGGGGVGGASAMMGGVNMMRSVGGSMTNAAMGGGSVSSGQFMHQSQPVFPGHIQPGLMPHPYLHPQMKQMQAQQLHHQSMQNATTEQQVRQQQQQAVAHALMTTQQQGYPPQNPGSAPFQQTRNITSQQQQQPAQQVQQAGQAQSSLASAAPQAPPSDTSLHMPPAHFPQAFPSAHPLSQQTPQHFPSALPPAGNHQALFQHLPGGVGGGGRADIGAAVQGRMMSQAVGAAALPGGTSASSGPQGSSAFTYGGNRVVQCWLCICYFVALPIA